MKGILAIYRREMGSYFVSPVAYVVIGFFLLMAGFFFFNILSQLIEQQMMMAMQSQRMGAPPDMDIPSEVIRYFMGLMSTFSLFMVPMLTMGVYAEERRRGTMEMLMTSPLSELQIVLGKFLASFTLYIIMIAPTILYMLIMAAYSDPGIPWKVMWAGYLGTFLLGAVFVAIGSFISSLTESQIVAAVVTFVVFLLLWVIDFGVRGSSSTLASVLSYMSIIRHYDDFSKGIIDTTALVYYITLTGLAIFLTLRTLDSMRWRRA